MQHQCVALAIVVLLLGCCPTQLKADECYQNKDSTEDAYLKHHFYGPFADVSKKPCPGSTAKGCYEFYTKGPGHIRYRAGCDASACPEASGFDANLHTCVKCQDKPSDKVAAAGGVICSTASIMPSLVSSTSKKHKCPYTVQYKIVSPGSVKNVNIKGGDVFCNTDTACATTRWLSSNSDNTVSNVTGCISDCNKEFLAAGGTGKCVECDSKLDCDLKQLKVTIVKVAGPNSGGSAGGQTTTKGSRGLHSRALAAAEIGALLGIMLSIGKFQ